MDCKGFFTRATCSAAAALLLLATPAMAQFSDSYNFLKAVRDKDGAKVTQFVEAPGSSTLVNTRDYNSGEGALHIVVKRRDDAWLRFLLAKGANPNLRDKEGNTPLLIATQLGFIEGVSSLVANKADVNFANDRGETALILAVQIRNLPIVRALLAAGADSRKADHIAGMSARDYAERDPRAVTIFHAIEEASKSAPAAPKARISGPGL